MKLDKEKLLQIQNIGSKMTIKLTERQIESVVSNLSKEQLIDFLARDIDKSVDWICEFVWNYVDNEVLQNKIRKSFPPVQMELFD